jgi:aryl-alcohol dehydrogenase-like predicted oxidoreductase
MDSRQLGSSDLHITPIGFGAWAIGGSGWEFAWGAQDDQHSIAAIRQALDAGINWIHTAAVYSLGHSEEVVARALEGVRDRPYVFPKCSMIWSARRDIGHGLGADSSRRECEASLRRLKADAIDLYQIHWPNPDQDTRKAGRPWPRFRPRGRSATSGCRTSTSPR